MLSKNKEGKISVNLSPSSLNLFYKSPLLFYLTYIEKVEDDTPVPICYGLSGNIVHECLEKYAKGELDRDGAFLLFFQSWEKKGLNIHKDLKGNLLPQIDYLSAILYGMSVIDEHKDHVCEEKIHFPLKENESLKIGLKGIIDLQATRKEDSSPLIIDYKTSNNIAEGDDFLRQALFYNLLIYKKKNILPKRTIFHYLKLSKSVSYEFEMQEIEDFAKELESVANKLLSYGLDINNYPIGNIDDVFNGKKQACLREIERRANSSQKV